MILLINTCGADAIVALAEGLEIIAQESLPGREASEKLIPTLHRLLAGTEPLTAVGVVHGPGSFTGVRVGLSAAKGLCEARAIGMVAMSRLALVAIEAQSESTLALLDAGRGEFYAGLYQGSVLEREEILKRDQLPHGRLAITCEPRVYDTLSHDCTLVPEPGAHAMAAIAARRIARGEWSDVATLDANYLRRTDAELLQERSREVQ